MIKKLIEKIEHHFKEVLRIKTSPESIAIGFVLGTLLAILPTFGLGIFIGLGIILIFEKVSKLSMFAAFFIWNPFVLVSLIPLEYWIGNLIFGDAPIQIFKIEILNQIFTYSRRFLVGNLIVAIIASTISYPIVKIIVIKYQKKL